MIYNIIFLLKLRKYIFNLYQENRLYKFSIDSNPYICDIEGTFDTESKLVFAYLKKYCIPKHIYILQNICNFNFNILVCSYQNKDDVLNIFNAYADKRDEYTKKNILSCILFACKYKNRYFIFSTFIRTNGSKFDKNNETHLEFIKYYFQGNIDYNKLLFSNDVIKYIKFGDKFKLTKYNPFLINL